MGVYLNLSNVTSISDASLTSIVSTSNRNFSSLQAALSDFFALTSFNEASNRINFNELLVSTLKVDARFEIVQNGQVKMVVTSDGAITAESIRTNLVQTPLLRLEDNIEALPLNGVGGDLIYVDDQAPEGEGFYGYLETLDAWVKLSPGVAGGGAPGTAFTGIADLLGTIQFGATNSTDTLQFEGQGGTTVNFDPVHKRVIISSADTNVDSFSQIADGSGTLKLTAPGPNSTLRFEGQGGTSVQFNPVTNAVIISSATSNLGFLKIGDAAGVVKFSATSTSDTLRFAHDNTIAIGFDQATKKITITATGIFTSLTTNTLAVNTSITVYNGSTPTITLLSNGTVTGVNLTATGSVNTPVLALGNNVPALASTGTAGQVVYADSSAPGGEGYYGYTDTNGWIMLSGGQSPNQSAGNTFNGIADKLGNLQFSADDPNSTLRFEGQGNIQISFDPATKKIILNSPVGATTAFSQIANAAGTVQLTATGPSSTLRVEGTGATTVQFNPVNNKITINSPAQASGFAKVADSGGTVRFTAGSVQDTVRFAGVDGIIVTFDSVNKQVIIGKDSNQNAGNSFTISAEDTAIASTDPASPLTQLQNLNFKIGPTSQTDPVVTTVDPLTGTVTVSIRGGGGTGIGGNLGFELFTVNKAKGSTFSLTLSLQFAEIDTVTINGISLIESVDWATSGSDSITISNLPYALDTTDIIEVRYRPL